MTTLGDIFGKETGFLFQKDLDLNVQANNPTTVIREVHQQQQSTHESATPSSDQLDGSKKPKRLKETNSENGAGRLDGCQIVSENDSKGSEPSSREEGKSWSAQANDEEFRPKGPMVQDIPRIDGSTMTSEDLREYVSSLPIVFVTGIMSCMNPKVFSMEEMAKEYRTEAVDVLLQDPDSTGFSIPPNKRIDQNLGEYIQYAQQLKQEVEADLIEIDRKVLSKMQGITTGNAPDQDSIGQLVGRIFPECPLSPVRPATAGRSMTMTCTEPQQGTPPRRAQSSSAVQGPSKTPQVQQPQQQKMVKFCVNVDCGKWPTVIAELSKLPQWCKWGADDAILSCLPSDMTIPGMSLPQLYFKVPGVWTGSHEENIRFHSINNNHGPGNSVWGAIAPEHVPKLRQIVLKKHGVDMYKTEGRWFPGVEFCVTNGIPVMIGVQRPGDTAILNGATLHWVRSGGFSVNSSWNFGVRKADQLDMAFERDKINLELGVRNIVPLRSLVVEVLKNFRTVHQKQSKQQSEAQRLTISSEERAFLECGWKHVHEQGELESGYAAKLDSVMKANSRRPKFDVFLEPLNSVVVLCDRCWGEIVHNYVVCDSCAELNAEKGVEYDAKRALPIFFCVPCGLEHMKAKKNHHTEGRYKRIEEEWFDLAEWASDWKQYFDGNVLHSGKN